jgi:3-deoxy-D-manno-octulosonate 8-phosphate phosphatase (KDO 8-P phosphatase)
MNRDMQSGAFNNNLVSHRGNLNGPNVDIENNPKYVIEALKSFRVEVDCWFSKGKFYLGHDEPRYEIDKYFLFNSALLIHCKNLDLFMELRNSKFANIFFQDSEPVVITSKQERIIHADHFDQVKQRANSRDILVELEYGKTLKTERPARKFSTITDYPGNFLTYNTGFRKIDLLIIDIDGVMTSGKKIYDLSGTAIQKEFCDRDFTAIKRLKANGVSVCFLSGDRIVNEAMALNRGVDYYFARDSSGNIDKKNFLADLKKTYKANNIGYVGDDYYDVTIMDEVDVSFCPHDASLFAQRSADVITKSKGGEGVIAEIFDLIIEGLPEHYAVDTHK